MSKVVTPSDDEVCFQCWDAKIRTSPKRKIHFKTLDEQSVAPPAMCNLNRHKRRALSGFECSMHATCGISVAHNQPKDNEANSYTNFIGSEVEPASIYEESIIFDEENAVVLLSTAFRTVPHINIEISSYEVSDQRTFSDKKRSAYHCGRCGKLKQGHLCDVPSPHTNLSSSPQLPIPIQAISIQMSPVLLPHPAHTSSELSPIDIAVIAQPVVS